MTAGQAPTELVISTSADGVNFNRRFDEEGAQDAESPSPPKEAAATRGASQARPWRLLEMVGPGLMACLADTDAGCLIVAAQSGARWGYSLLLVQVLLVPVLFLAQDLTVRLGVYTQQGLCACIRQHYGRCWAWVSTVPLILQCVAAMVSQMSGVAAIGELWGLGRTVATLMAAGLVAAIVFLCKYRQIELIGVTFGLFELSFIATMFCYHPSPAVVFAGAVDIPADAEYMKLVATNIGAVIMPWMIYFQQSAVAARGLSTAQELGQERLSTLFGSCLTQLVMIGALATLAAATSARKDLKSVGQIVEALEPALGKTTAKVFVSLGFVGGSVCAAFVVSLAASWALCEAMGSKEVVKLDRPIRQAKLFYGSFLVVVGVGIGILAGGADIVQLNVAIELIGGLLMPMVVGFLYFLATGSALPPEVRVAGWKKVALATIFIFCSALSVGTGIYGHFG